MLRSTAFFRGIDCPFYTGASDGQSGCNRPYCHFRHSNNRQRASAGVYEIRKAKQGPSDSDGELCLTYFPCSWCCECCIGSVDVYIFLSLRLIHDASCFRSLNTPAVQSLDYLLIICAWNKPGCLCKTIVSVTDSFPSIFKCRLCSF